jgi:hypothetical protein
MFLLSLSRKEPPVRVVFVEVLTPDGVATPVTPLDEVPVAPVKSLTNPDCLRPRAANLDTLFNRSAAVSSLSRNRFLRGNGTTVS